MTYRPRTRWPLVPLLLPVLVACTDSGLVGFRSIEEQEVDTDEDQGPMDAAMPVVDASRPVPPPPPPPRDDNEEPDGLDDGPPPPEPEPEPEVDGSSASPVERDEDGGAPDCAGEAGCLIRCNEDGPSTCPSLLPVCHDDICVECHEDEECGPGLFCNEDVCSTVDEDDDDD